MNFLIIFLLIFSPKLLNASGFDKTSRGTATAQFLKIMVSPRGAAMGEAISASVKDASALDINPACIMNIKKESLFMTHSKYFADTSLDYISYAQNLGEETGAWGLSIKYFNWGKIESTDEGGGSLDSISPYDIAASVSFSTYISGFNKDEEERFVFGGTGKIVRMNIKESDNTVSADIGLLTPYMFENKFRMSFVIQNLLGRIKLDKESSDIPLVIKLGSVVYFNKFTTITADLIAPKDSVFYLSMGSEMKINIANKTTLFLRGGFNTRNLFDISGFKNITGGFGFKYKQYFVDYAFTPYGELGNIHRLSLSINY